MQERLKGVFGAFKRELFRRPRVTLAVQPLRKGAINAAIGAKKANDGPKPVIRMERGVF